ncbi:MAG: pyridoxamine kinase [Clostridia bacterium]|nr:pyridoxamine kinase [Clostridia bacterium]
MSQKRIAAIHDISCFGRCSLTVALPIISAAGIETTVIPTAILSTHTGGFSGYTFRDLTCDILPVAEHWKKEGIAADAVYTGYLGSKKQVKIVCEAAKLIKKEGALLIVDPAMADHGKLYGGFSEDFPREMAKLCRQADILVPNITEACMLLGLPYREGPYTEEFINSLLTGLYALTGADIVLTGVWFDYRRIGAACLKDGKTEFIFSERIDACYHGTGDVFASCLVAALMNDRSLKAAAQIAVNFTCECIKRSIISRPDDRYGVCFEQELPNLIRILEL